MTQGTGSRHCTVSSGEHKVDGCSITARLSPPMDLSSHNKPSLRPEVSILIPHGSTRAPFVTQPLAGQTIIILHIFK